MLRKLTSSQEGKAYTQSVFSSLYLEGTVLLLRDEMPGLFCSEGLITRVIAVCLPALSEPCKHIPRSYCHYP